MKISQLSLGPTRIEDLDFDTLNEEANYSWQRKADKLQARRWKKVQREFKSNPYLDYKVNRRGGIL